MYEKLAVHTEQIDTLEKLYCDLKNDVKDIKENLLKRPSWSVTIIITLLSSVCIGLVVNTFK